MTFHTRNAYYLRISSNSVLPLFVRGLMADPQLTILTLDILDNVTRSYTSTNNIYTGCQIEYCNMYWQTCARCESLYCQISPLCSFNHTSIIPKLQAEADVGSRGPVSGAKKGTVDVKRGGEGSMYPNDDALI
jgi:hypothetical protein